MITIRKQKPTAKINGQYKTMDQLMRQSMTVLQYGRYIAQQGVTRG